MLGATRAAGTTGKELVVYQPASVPAVAAARSTALVKLDATAGAATRAAARPAKATAKAAAKPHRLRKLVLTAATAVVLVTGYNVMHGMMSGPSNGPSITEPASPTDPSDVPVSKSHTLTVFQNKAQVGVTTGGIAR
jgi:hypothetical protein